MDIEIYGTIGVDVTAQSFLDQLPESGPVRVRVNSGGGSATEAIAIYSRLREHDGEVEMLVDGLAASAATMIAMAGTVITMRSNAMMMLHKPWAGTAGDADEMRRAAKVLDMTEDSMVEMYAERSGQKPETVRAMLKEETWLSAQDAVELGFADRIIKAGDKSEPMRVAAMYVLASATNKELPKYDLPAGLQNRAPARVNEPTHVEADMPDETKADARDERIKELEAENAELKTALEANREEVDEATEVADAQAKRIEALEDEVVVRELQAKLTGEHYDFAALANLKRANEALFTSTIATLVNAEKQADKQKPIGVTGSAPISGTMSIADILAEAERAGKAYGNGTGFGVWVATHYPDRAAEVTEHARKAR